MYIICMILKKIAIFCQRLTDGAVVKRVLTSKICIVTRVWKKPKKSETRPEFFRFSQVWPEKPEISLSKTRPGPEIRDTRRPDINLNSIEVCAKNKFCQIIWVTFFTLGFHEFFQLLFNIVKLKNSLQIFLSKHHGKSTE